MELILIVVVTSILTLLVELTTGVPRIVLGAVFLLLFPGYALVAAVFPRKGTLRAVERIVLSVVLSIAITPLAGLILNYTPWGIRLESIFVTVASLVLIASAVAVLRRGNLPASERFEPSIHLRVPRLDGMTGRNKILYSLLMVSVLAGVGTLTYVLAAPKAHEPFTDFYVLGSGGMARDYPHDLALGEQAEVILGIENNQRRYAEYRIEVVLSGEKEQEIGPIGLASGEAWQGRVAIAPTKVGEDQKVEFLLYEGDGIQPYSTLHLWLDVREKE